MRYPFPRLQSGIGLWLLIALFVLSSPSAPATAWGQQDDPKPAPAKTTDKPESTSPAEKKETDEEADPFVIPEDADADDLLEFIDELFQTPPPENTQPAMIAHFQKVAKTAGKAADKILLMQDVDEEPMMRAIVVKFQMLLLEERLGDKTARPKLFKFAEVLEKDKRPAIATLGAQQLLLLRVQGVKTLKPAERQKLIADIVKWMSRGPVGEEQAATAIRITELLEASEEYETAAQACEAFAKVLATSDDEEISEHAAKLEGMARRMRLPGKSVEIAGEMLDGSEFDWSKYRNKVVLIDFWATWCTPCMEELPNLKKQYGLYHDRGFEVVGISIDDDKSEVEAFVDEHKIPWNILFSSDAEAQGWDHPLAVRYGITGIPATILVNQQGKVVTFAGRGEDLGMWLEKLLGSPEPAAKAPTAPGKSPTRVKVAPKKPATTVPE